MPNITLPDGKKISFDEKINGIQIAEKISKSLSKQALIISVDDELKDLNFDIEKDCSVKIITSKDSEGLDAIRHDLLILWQCQFKNYFQEQKLQLVQ